MTFFQKRGPTADSTENCTMQGTALPQANSADLRGGFQNAKNAATAAQDPTYITDYTRQLQRDDPVKYHHFLELMQILAKRGLSDSPLTTNQGLYDYSPSPYAGSAPGLPQYQESVYGTGVRKKP